MLALIGGLVSLWVLSMWLMHAMMMGSDGMSSMACPAFCFLPVLLLGLVMMVVAIILLGRNRVK